MHSDVVDELLVLLFGPRPPVGSLLIATRAPHRCRAEAGREIEAQKSEVSTEDRRRRLYSGSGRWSGSGRHPCRVDRKTGGLALGVVTGMLDACMAHDPKLTDRFPSVPKRSSPHHCTDALLCFLARSNGSFTSLSVSSSCMARAWGSRRTPTEKRFVAVYLEPVVSDSTKSRAIAFRL
ncbi:hypothetical protein GW17_00061204 [Ensete ventricosum]|nr:hypothetical protein GW17_00061204 [Ensete ventricosum]